MRTIEGGAQHECDRLRLGMLVQLVYVVGPRSSRVDGRSGPPVSTALEFQAATAPLAWNCSGERVALGLLIRWLLRPELSAQTNKAGAQGHCRTSELLG
jgi:hypothetical protein